MNNSNKCRLYRLFSFIIPIVILCVYFIWKGITPFGGNTFLIHDMDAQYIDFFAYLKECIGGNNNFIYSFSRGLGGDFGSFFAYYLTSPFNIITMLFPDKLMPVGISLEMLLLFGLCGAACYYSLEYITKSEHKLMLLFFSAAYSLSGWMLINAENFQFIPEAAVLPMVIVSCQKMKETGKMISVILWLAISVIMNFYIGYMIFIFAFLWLIIPDGKKISIKYFGVFLFAALISSLIWIPVLRQIGSTVKSLESNWYEPNFNFSIVAFLKKFLPGQFNYLQYMDEGLPAVYCSMLTIISAAIYFIYCDDSAEKRHRSILLIILFISLIFHPLTMVWQGFSRPRWWPYRFSFILIYLIVLCAASNQIKIPWFILPIGIAGLIYNMFVTFDVKLYYTVPMSVYSEAVQNKKSLLDSIETENEFFRIEDLHPRSDNDAMHFSYAGITHFDSLANRYTVDFLRTVGFPQDRYTVQYGLGNTEFANSLLGVRYVLDVGEVRKRDFPASTAYLVRPNMDINYQKTRMSAAAFQNELARALGSSSEILTQIEVIDSEITNLECDESFCWRPDPLSESSITYQMTVPEGSTLYASVDETFLVGELFFMTEEGKVPLKSPDRLIPLQMGNPQGELTVMISVESSMTDNPNITFYAEDPNTVSDLFLPIASGIFVEKLSSSSLLIHLPEHTEQKTLLVTVPYDPRWKAATGNNTLEPHKIWDTFLAVDVPDGSSEVRLDYR